MQSHADDRAVRASLKRLVHLHRLITAEQAETLCGALGIPPRDIL